MQINGTSLSRHVRIRTTELRRRLTRPVHSPSFYAAIDRRQHTWTALVRIHGSDAEIYPEYSKLNARRLAEAAGVTVPRLLDGPINVDDLRLDEYGPRFVIKPNWGASSRGVFVLDRGTGDQFTNLFDGATLSGADLRESVRLAIDTARRGDVHELVVEESIATSSALPTDWKIYTFYGEIGLILQVDRTSGSARSKFYSPDWKDLGRVRKDRRVDPSLPPPEDGAALLAAARAISSKVRTGFLRVDLFAAPDGGAIAGEVALLPGGDQYYGRTLDRALGEQWEAANVRLLSDRQPLIP